MTSYLLGGGIHLCCESYLPKYLVSKVPMWTLHCEFKSQAPRAANASKTAHDEMACRPLRCNLHAYHIVCITTKRPSNDYHAHG